MAILMEKGKCRASRNLLIRAASYITARNRTVLTLHKKRESRGESRDKGWFILTILQLRTIDSG